MTAAASFALVPDLADCMSDAVDAWIDEAKALGRPIPPPSRHLVAAE
jgi:hypothetical protein